MLKFNCTLLIFFFSHAICFAQVNIIKDGSFEDTSKVWQNFGDNRTLNHWQTIDTCCIYNNLNFWLYQSINRINDTGIFKLPNTVFGYQYPRHGLGAILLSNYIDANIEYWAKNYRSVLRGYLINKLKVGKEYCATVYVSADERPDYFVTDGLDLYFDNGSIDSFLKVNHDSTGNYTAVNPQVRCNYVLADTQKWMKVQGTFIANGSETKITIGNFRPNHLLNKLQSYGSITPPLAYSQCILIDDVSLIPTDLHDWLHDTACTIGDSVWVGLNQFDYPDGVWYNSIMKPIDTAQGFWFKPEAPVTSFIQGVEVCGAWHYDTMKVYTYPLTIDNGQLKMDNVKIYPNPASEKVSISISIIRNNQQPLQVLDATGKEVYSILPTTNYTTIDVSNFAKGIYLVKYGGSNVRLLVD